MSGASGNIRPRRISRGRSPSSAGDKVMRPSPYRIRPLRPPTDRRQCRCICRAIAGQCPGHFPAASEQRQGSAPDHFCAIAAQRPKNQPRNCRAESGNARAVPEEKQGSVRGMSAQLSRSVRETSGELPGRVRAIAGQRPAPRRRLHALQPQSSGGPIQLIGRGASRVISCAIPGRHLESIRAPSLAMAT